MLCTTHSLFLNIDCDTETALQTQYFSTAGKEQWQCLTLCGIEGKGCNEIMPENPKCVLKLQEYRCWVWLRVNMFFVHRSYCLKCRIVAFYFAFSFLLNEVSGFSIIRFNKPQAATSNGSWYNVWCQVDQDELLLCTPCKVLRLAKLVTLQLIILTVLMPKVTVLDVTNYWCGFLCWVLTNH